MPKHKAATEVTIAPLAEKTGFASFVERYWKLGLGLFAVVAAAVLFGQYRAQSAQVTTHRSWNELSRTAGLDSPAGVQAASPTALEDLAARLGDVPAAPWALALAAPARAAGRDYAGALEDVRTLRQRFPSHPLVALALPFGADGSDRPIADVLEERLQSRADWLASAPGLFSNPALPDGSPRVRLRTSAGDIVLGLYADRAPGHAENFLKLGREGYYDGTRFHRVVPGFMVQGGDPNSRGDDTSTWGSGGPDATQPQEFSDLSHFPMVLAAAKRENQTESSGSQFYITLGAAHNLDGVHTVFGTVLEGEDVVRRIGAGELVENTDRPRDPVAIVGFEAL
ncbi:MAG TPA: peptidylprolyl isomerase [Planctomycetota bacterium]|nr:peptidylprolyl isomerase [Planctomycetota bacterium]